MSVAPHSDIVGMRFFVVLCKNSPVRSKKFYEYLLNILQKIKMCAKIASLNDELRAYDETNFNNRF